MCTPWMIKKLSKWQYKVMCKCSYIINEENPNRRRSVIASSSSSQQTNAVSSPTSSTSQRRVSTTFFSSPRSQSARRSQALEAKSTTNEARRSGGSSPRIFLPQLKRGKLKRRVTIGSTQSNSSGSADNIDEADWPPFADEDYIVFCFEEDGAFHVVMEESPKTLTRKPECEDHGTVSCACTDDKKDVSTDLSPLSRRDCFLPNQEGEEEEISGSQFSRKLQRDTTEKDSDLLVKDKIVLRNESAESMECRNGSIESTDSSRLDWEEQLEDEISPDVECSYSARNSLGEDDVENGASRMSGDSLLPNKLVDEEIFLSPKSQLQMMITINDLLKIENDGSSMGSDESCVSGGSDTRADHDDQLEEDEEPTSESAKSSVSNVTDGSSSSFEFPVLEWELVGSPVTWPRAGKLHFRKQKSPRRACLRCCRF